MKVKDYKEFIKTTAIYPKDKEIEYLILGLFGEAGELCNLYKKVLRDNLPKEDWVPKFKKELGDFFWYLYSLENCGYLRVTITDRPTYLISIEYSLIDLFDTISYIKIHPDTLNVSRFIHNVIENQLNSSLEEILQINVDKLSSRKERGVLGGSGDNR